MMVINWRDMVLSPDLDAARQEKARIYGKTLGDMAEHFQKYVAYSTYHTQAINSMATLATHLRMALQAEQHQEMAAAEIERIRAEQQRKVDEARQAAEAAAKATTKAT